MDHKIRPVALCLAAALVLCGCGSRPAKVKDVRAIRSLRSGGDLKGDDDAKAGIKIIGESCGAEYQPGRAALRLLSHQEYDQTVGDLLYTQKKASTIAVFEAAPKGPTGFASDTANVPLTPLTVEKYWSAATQLADEVLVEKNKTGSAFSKIAPCAIGKNQVDAACYETVVSDLGLRAWRRPLSASGSDSEKARLLGLMQQAPNFDQGLKALISALLISPHFLFVSVPSEGARAEDFVNLDDFQIASRLSYFMWGTMPDEELFSLAQNGKLKDESTLAVQVSRMIRDDKARYLVAAIVNDWIGIDTLETMVTPGISDNLKRAMLEETWRFVADLVIQDKSVMNLVTAKYTFANRVLADHYGLSLADPNGTQFQTLDLSASPRRGVLSQASFLLATAGSNTETRPVKRGKEVALRWLCEEVPPPPPGVPPLDSSKLPPNATPREVLAVHTNSPSCTGCHEKLDPLGLGFESFDAVGKWRTLYAQLGNATIDSSGRLDANTEFKDTRELLSEMGESARVKSCMAKKIMELATKRVASTKDDVCVTDVIGASKTGTAGKFSDLIKSVVLTRQFRLQSGDSP